jgi:Kef-type K+ transport system membrane component KefB
MFNLSILLTQIAVILSLSGVMGWIFKKFHQQQVIGELVAGIMLGPSLLGRFAPEISATLFPSWSLDFINALSQIGIVVFMFLAGLELSPEMIQEHRRSALVIAMSALSFQCCWGVCLPSISILHFLVQVCLLLLLLSSWEFR